MRVKSTDERRLFVNGVLDGASFGSANLLRNNPSVSMGGNTGDGRCFLGQMDEVRVYNRAPADEMLSESAQAMPGTNQ